MNRKVTHYLLCAFEDKLSPCQKRKKAHYLLDKQFRNEVEELRKQQGGLKV